MQKEESRKINRTKEIRERFQAEKDTEKKNKGERLDRTYHSGNIKLQNYYFI